MADGAAPVLEVRGLKTVFRTRGGEIHAVNDVSFSLHPGELLGVVGESGSGKSVTMMSLLRLLPAPPADIRGGTAVLKGREHGRITIGEAITLTDVSRNTLKQHFRALVKRGHLSQHGRHSQKQE